MRIAVVSTGLGRVLRGFEAFSDSLFRALRRYAPEVEVTLFQGGGAADDGRVVVANFYRADIPARWFGPLTASQWEKRSFALALYPMLRRRGYDLVHYNELTMGSALYHLRRLFGGRFKLLYCNGAPSPPLHYHHRCDFAQVLTGPDHEQTLRFGMPESRLFPIPYGVDATLFHPDRKAARERIRRELGIPSEAPVVLSVAALKREHKRIDYLIEETARIGRDIHLVVAGQPTADMSDLEALAERSLPGRWRFVSWPHDRIAGLYGAADAFALCSLSEAFGLVTIEAILSELPVVIHNGAIFRWLTQGTTAQTIDMSRRGALSDALCSLFGSGRRAGDLRPDLQRSRGWAKSRFSWEALTPRYVDMYREAIEPGSIGRLTEICVPVS